MDGMGRTYIKGISSDFMAGSSVNTLMTKQEKNQTTDSRECN